MAFVTSWKNTVFIKCLLDCLIKLLLNPAPWKILLLHSGGLEYFPSIQKFLPSTVTDQVQILYSGETNIDASMLDTTEAAVQSTSTLASSNPGCSLEAVPETSLNESIAPLPNKATKNSASQENFFCHHHTHTCEKKTFPSAIRR